MPVFAQPPRHSPNLPTITPWHDCMDNGVGASNGVAASATWPTANKAVFFPIYLPEPFVVSKGFWCNGATVGTDSIDLAIYLMTDMTLGRLDCLRSFGAVLSAGTVNAVQEVSALKIARANITSGGDSTDRSSGPGYTTASVTLKAGRLYLMAVENSATSAAVVSAITGGGTWVSRSSVQYNGTANRTSIWSLVPAVDYTGTIDIAFGATQTGACWSLDEMSGVDTSSSDGIVQQATGTGSSTTPLATLAAFANANNATYGAHGHAAATATTPKATFTELSDVTTATPAQALETEWLVSNDTAVNATITSAAWGSCAVEIKADASSLVIPPSMPGAPIVYMGFAVGGTTATVFRRAGVLNRDTVRGLQALTAFPLPSNVTPTAISTNQPIPLAGFSSRSLIG